MELSGQLKIARINAGLSQAQVATKMGLSQSAVSQIESGRRKVSRKELAKFGRIYSANKARQSELALTIARELATASTLRLEQIIEMLNVLRRDEIPVHAS